MNQPEVVMWNEEHSVFCTALGVGAEVHPANSEAFRHPGGEWQRRSTRVYWTFPNTSIKDLVDPEMLWASPA